MGADACEKCGQPGVKTFWVDDQDWLCVKCFKDRKGKK